jgi:2-keto-4-pentenoate hydratase/2-oxohepta-3-ene-1,7-dioic acid hydratase in catechol pathway
MKIFAVAHNYAEHNKELNTVTPSEPVFFMKPDTAALRNNKPFYIPEFTQELHYETEVIIKFNRIGKHISSKFANRYISEVGLGVDFTARDVQRKLKAEGKPWEICKAFDNSAVIGNFISTEQISDIQNLNFRLDINGHTVQQGNTSEMIFPIDKLISKLSCYFTVKIGDILFTGTPVGVGMVSIGDRLEGYLEDEKMFDFKIK